MTSRKHDAEPRDEMAKSLTENEKPSQAGASQQAWRQASIEGMRDSIPGAMAVPTRVPTRSMRGSARKREGAQYGVADGVADIEGDRIIDEAVNRTKRMRLLNVSAISKPFMSLTTEKGLLRPALVAGPPLPEKVPELHPEPLGRPATTLVMPSAVLMLMTRLL